MAMPIDPKRMRLLDSFINNARARRGVRPEGFYDHMRPGSPKYIDDEWAWKQPSSLPANMESYRKNGMSYKMIPSDRIYANQWYANPENQRLAGYEQPVDPQVFKQDFIHRPGPTLNEREMAQRAYDKQVGRDVARQVAENRMVQRQFSPENEHEVVVPDWAMNYIANGDPTGLSPQEIQAVDNFVMKFGDQYKLLEEEPGLYTRNDLPGDEGRLGGNAYRANFYPPVDKFGRRR